MQRLRYRFVRASLPVMLVLAALWLASCSDDDNPITPAEEHFDAVGLIIYQSGVKVLDYFGPDYDISTQVAEYDTLYASQGLNPHWDVMFYDSDTSEMVRPSGEDKSFSAEFADTSLAELWWHAGEEGSFEFHLKGLREGTTTVEFQVLHLDHADFTTLPIPLVIGSAVLHDVPIGVFLYDEETSALLATAGLSGTGQTTDTLILNSGDSTDHIEAVFFDEDDIQFQPDVPPHSLVVVSSDTTIASVTGQDPMEPWAFRLRGNNAGSCTVTVYIYHDGNVGVTFAPIAVKVE